MDEFNVAETGACDPLPESDQPHLTECCGGGDEGHSCPVLPGNLTSRPGPLDGCPTPLSWQQVLEVVQNEGTPFAFPGQGGQIQGRVLGNGPPLYLLCGMGGSSNSFCLLSYLLRDLFRCVMFDYPGTITCRNSRQRLTLDEYSNDLLAIGDHLGDERFNLFATSFGSLVAQVALRKASNRIRAAVLQGAFACRRLSVAERFIIQVGKVVPGNLRTLPFAKMVQEQNHKRWFPALDPTRWQFFLEDAGQVSLKTLSDRGGLIRDTDLRPYLNEIKQPVLLIQCEGDGLVSRECHRELALGLVHGHSVWMHSSGHVPHMTNPHRLAKYIRDFLTNDFQLAPQGTVH